MVCQERLVFQPFILSFDALFLFGDSTDWCLGVRPLMDFPSSMAPLRGYTATAPQQLPHDDHADARHRELMSSSSGDDNILDPVSALLRAGEIVNQNSRDRSGS
jgi:hypothetical protein